MFGVGEGRFSLGIQRSSHKQRVYHNALKVFMFKFRFNGFLWYVLCTNLF